MFCIRRIFHGTHQNHYDSIGRKNLYTYVVTGQARYKSGTESMTMHTTMIWAVRTRVRSMPAPFLVDLGSTPIHEEEELAGHQQRRVKNPNEIALSFTFEVLVSRDDTSSQVMSSHTTQKFEVKLRC